MNILTQIPAAYRRVLYLTYAVTLVLVGATQVIFASLENGQPAWLTAAINVLAYLGGALGLTAASNVSLSDELSDDEEVT